MEILSWYTMGTVESICEKWEIGEGSMIGYDHCSIIIFCGGWYRSEYTIDFHFIFDDICIDPCIYTIMGDSRGGV
jgi:hypothetical protein